MRVTDDFDFLHLREINVMGHQGNRTCSHRGHYLNRISGSLRLRIARIRAASLPDLLREFGSAVRAFSSAEEFLASRLGLAPPQKG